MSAPDLATALHRLQIALVELPSGPVRSDLQQAIAIARFDAEGAGDGPALEVSFGQFPSVPEGPLFPGLQTGPLTDAITELQRALIWEADNADFTDANLNSAVYLRAAGHLHRAAARLAQGEYAAVPSLQLSVSRMSSSNPNGRVSSIANALSGAHQDTPAP